MTKSRVNEGLSREGGRKVYGGAFKKGKRFFCWLRVTEERLLLCTGIEDASSIRIMYDWDTYDTLL